MQTQRVHTNTTWTYKHNVYIQKLRVHTNTTCTYKHNVNIQTQRVHTNTTCKYKHNVYIQTQRVWLSSNVSRSTRYTIKSRSTLTTQFMSVLLHSVWASYYTMYERLTTQCMGVLLHSVWASCDSLTIVLTIDLLLTHSVWSTLNTQCEFCMYVMRESWDVALLWVHSVGFTLTTQCTFCTYVLKQRLTVRDSLSVMCGRKAHIHMHIDFELHLEFVTHWVTCVHLRHTSISSCVWSTLNTQCKFCMYVIQNEFCIEFCMACRRIQTQRASLFRLHTTCMERWGAGVEYHFQEISWNLRPVVNGT